MQVELLNSILNRAKWVWTSPLLAIALCLPALAPADEQEKLVTIDVSPASPDYGKVVHTLSVGGRNEAHHSSLTDDRHYLWSSGLDTGRIFIFDVRALPRRNVMITSSFTGWNNYMMNLGRVMADAEAMKRFGNTVVIWDLHTRKPKKILDVPGTPLEIRCAWGPHNNYCFTTTALTSKIWLILEDEAGEWQAQAVADIGNAADIPLPVDISVSADDSLLWADTWKDGKSHPRLVSASPGQRQDAAHLRVCCMPG